MLQNYLFVFGQAFYICQKQIVIRKEPCEQAKCLFLQWGHVVN